MGPNIFEAGPSLEKEAVKISVTRRCMIPINQKMSEKAHTNAPFLVSVVIIRKLMFTVEISLSLVKALQ